MRLIFILGAAAEAKPTPSPKDHWQKCAYDGEPIEPHDVEWTCDSDPYHRSRGCREKHCRQLAASIY